MSQKSSVTNTHQSVPWALTSDTTAISHQIRLLEEITGQALFRRRPRPITLTEARERLFPVLRDGLDRFAATVAGLRADADQSPLVVAATTAFASRWLVPRLAKLKQDIDLDLQIEASETPANLRSGAADFAKGRNADQRAH